MMQEASTVQPDEIAPINISHAVIENVQSVQQEQRYKLTEKLLGKGSFGQVFLGKDTKTQDVVAIKIVNRKALADRWPIKGEAQQEEEIKFLQFNENDAASGCLPERNHVLKLLDAKVNNSI